MPKSGPLLRRAQLGLLVAVGLAAVGLLSACTGGSAQGSTTSGNGSPVAAGSSSLSGSASSGASSSTSSKPTPSQSTSSGPPPTPVKVVSNLYDGETVGVGEPIVMGFTPTPTNAAAFEKAVTVTVDGKPAGGAWFWEKPYADAPVEAHYRPQNYWPANSTIQVKLPISGLSAGKGLAYSGALSSVTFHTGDAHVSTVNGATEKMTVTDNGKVVRTIPVSLGKSSTPTYIGTKVVMQKGEDTPGTSTLRPDGAVRMIGPGYNEIVDWSVRVTTSGEYVHAAPWNSRIGQVSTSNGCTNLSVADAEWFYNFAQLGDVVTYSNTAAGATTVPTWDGYGDWNVPWQQWVQGGPKKPSA